MFEPHIQKVIFVDEPFLTALELGSITDFRAFSSAELDTQIVTLPLQSKDVGELVKHVAPSEVRPGAILVKPDYSDKFMSMEAFADGHAERKYRLWILLCLALGAKKVSISNIEDITVELDDSASTAVGGGLKAPVGSASAEFKVGQSSQHSDVRKSMTEIKAEATGGEPDLTRAMEILMRHGLYRDDMFQRMYEMRSLTNNAVRKQEFSLDLSSDVKRVFDSSLKAKVKLMSKLYGGNADFEKVHRSFEKARTALKLTVLVEF